MAPLTALLVVQVSIYQTLRTAVRRVASVVAGVLLALGLSAWVGFTWWSLGIAIALGLAVGYALRLREEVLEVPISAMLIMSVGTRSAATGQDRRDLHRDGRRAVAGFVLTSPRVAAGRGGDRGPLPHDGRPAGPDGRRARQRVRQGLRCAPGSTRPAPSAARSGRVDDALRQAEESTKLNPRSMRLPYSTMTLRQSLETLEHSAITLRVFARSLADTTRLAGDDNPLNDPDVRRGLADMLRELSAAVQDLQQPRDRVGRARSRSAEV